MAAASAQSKTQAFVYRPLDRSRNEIRFLKILPSIHTPSSAESLEIGNDPVHCRMEYHSFDKFVADAEEQTRQSNAASQNAEYDYCWGSPETVGQKRTKLLSERFAKNRSDLKRLFPREDWDELHEDSLWTEWMKTWLWAALPKEPNEEKISGYIALSYVWLREPRMSQSAARLFRLRRIFRDISPTCADLVEKAIPSATSHATAQDEDTAEIILDGSPFKVGRNLEDALRALRELPEVRAGLLVWADALCICQDDIQERNVEVTRMYSIYKNSARVALWLSEAEELHSKILEFMNFVGESLGHIEKLDKEIASAWLAQFNILDMIRMQADLSALPYWYRTWIVQEAAVAPNGSFVVCRSRRFPWMNILHFVYSFNKRRSEQFSNARILLALDNSSPVLGHKYLRFNGHLMCLQDAFGCIKARPQRSTEEAILEWFGSLFLRLASMTDCQDSRDRVYGLMNLFPGDLPRTIKPDYSPAKTIAQVTADFVTAHIKATSKLHMLLLVTDISPTVDAWPSWVPNLSIPYKDITLTWTIRNGHLPMSQWKDVAEPYQADGSQKDAKVTWGPREAYGVPAISCQGIKLDVVCETGVEKSSEFIQTAKLRLLLRGRPLVDDEILLEMTRFLLAEGGDWELESFGWRIKDIVSSEMERTRISSHPEVHLRKGDAHRYGTDAGLREALESCFAAIGWKPNPQRTDISSIFDIPRASDDDLLESLQSGEYMEQIPHRTFSAMCERAAKIDFWGRNLESLFRDDGTKPYMHETRGPMLSRLDDGHRRERGNLFITAGGYVGATLDRLQPGDEIYILFGSIMPVVLRKFDGAYRMISKVYVHGAMNGEAVDKFMAEERRQCDVVTIL